MQRAGCFAMVEDEILSHEADVNKWAAQCDAWTARLATRPDYPLRETDLNHINRRKAKVDQDRAKLAALRELLEDCRAGRKPMDKLLKAKSEIEPFHLCMIDTRLGVECARRFM